MRNPGGYGITTYPDKKSDEEDTFTCCHCNSIVIVVPNASAASMGGWCALCAQPVCKNCAGKECFPFEKKLEQIENRARFFKSIGLEG